MLAIELPDLYGVAFFHGISIYQGVKIGLGEFIATKLNLEYNKHHEYQEFLDYSSCGSREVDFG